MTIIFNTIYLIGLIAISPYIIYKSIITGKYRRCLWRKFTGRILSESADSNRQQTIWFHGVSVGEIVMLQTVVATFRKAYPDWRCVVSATTDTGYTEAVKRFHDLEVVYWPLDFSWSVGKALALINPYCVVLAESEVWPNFVRVAKKRNVKIALVNGRMSPKSAKRFRKLRWLFGNTFRKIDVCAVQSEEIGRNFMAAGVPRDKIVVTGSVKYDGAQTDRENPRTRELRRLFRIGDDDLVFVAGSTQAPEEKMVLQILERIKEIHPRLRLIIVPRQKDRFDEVTRLLQKSSRPFVRRSKLPDFASCADKPIVLVDTIGELGAVWGLADIAFVGGSFDGKRGGQNMIEPAAFGAAVLFGPHNWNFRETVRLLLLNNAALEVADAGELEQSVRRLIDDKVARHRLGDAARQLVLSQQGATARTIEVLGSLVAWNDSVNQAA